MKIFKIMPILALLIVSIISFANAAVKNIPADTLTSGSIMGQHLIFYLSMFVILLS